MSILEGYDSICFKSLFNTEQFEALSVLYSKCQSSPIFFFKASTFLSRNNPWIVFHLWSYLLSHEKYIDGGQLYRLLREMCKAINSEFAFIDVSSRELLRTQLEGKFSIKNKNHILQAHHSYTDNWFTAN